MIYVLDTSALIVFGNYYPDTFKGFWENVEELVDSNRLTSVRQVKQELHRDNDKPHVADWAKNNEDVFPAPSAEAMELVGEIFRIRHFQQLVSKQQLLRKSPVADPWVIARAGVLDGCVVTEESWKPNAAQIPNVCEHFDIDCCNVSDMLEREGWIF